MYGIYCKMNVKMNGNQIMQSRMLIYKIILKWACFVNVQLSISFNISKKDKTQRVHYFDFFIRLFLVF